MKKQKTLKYMVMAAAAACMAAFPVFAEPPAPPAGDPDGQQMDAPPPGENTPPNHHRPPQNAEENGGVPPSPDDMRGDDVAPRIGSDNGSPAQDTGASGALPGTRMGGNDAPPPAAAVCRASPEPTINKNGK